MTAADATASALRLPPPREVTASALVRGLATAQRLIGPASILLAGGILFEVGARRGDVASVAPLAALLTLMLVSSLALAWRPTVLLAAAQLALGTVAGTAYAAVAMLTLSKGESQSAYLIEAIATALIFVGAIRPRASDGILWVSGAWLAGSVSLAAGAALVGETYVLSWDRVTDAGIICGAYAMVAIGWRRRRERLPELPELTQSSRSGEDQRVRERAATAVVHDTALAALTLVARSTPELDARLRQRIRRDLRIVATATVSPRGTSPARDPRGTSLGARLLAIVDDVRWRGMRVDVAGADAALGYPGDDAAEAILGATAAALDNVVAHSGTSHADVTLGSAEGLLTVMVVDGGRGFDPATVPADRLGLRESVVGRVERVGGSARVWSGATGTTVLLSVPAAPVATGDEVER
ncbi:MAG: hypothetical protein RIC81_06335 [Microcella pacifica]|jgi:signal transduction histidine kinase|uniref:Signal transduction histidine kinase n=1 Tax=Microcella pacifica TaxID=2591847 RepID=A0A9E5JTB4_9MICO|nr:hypothetical protein [Microcella pacifica]MBR22409.1 hypothetical protein [Leifsonia sp.]NHF62068.1 hypothetical protein [Microcella pacifica]